MLQNEPDSFTYRMSKPGHPYIDCNQPFDGEGGFYMFGVNQDKHLPRYGSSVNST